MPNGILADTPAYWRIDGTGPRAMFMLHCTMGHSGAWKGVMSNLGDVCHMVAMDLPEHGRSGPRSDRISWLSQSAAMSVELIRQGGVPVDLVGHSFGATVAIRIAVDRPDLVRTLTLIEPVFMSAARDNKRPEFDAYRNEPLEFMQLLESGDREGAARAFSNTWGGPVAWDDLPDAQRTYIRDRIEMIPAGGRSNMGEGPDYVPLSRIAKITAPTLLIEGGDTDRIISVIQDCLQGAFADVQRVIIPDAGHMVPITHPSDVATAIRARFNI